MGSLNTFLIESTEAKELKTKVSLDEFRKYCQDRIAELETEKENLFQNLMANPFLGKTSVERIDVLNHLIDFYESERTPKERKKPVHIIVKEVFDRICKEDSSFASLNVNQQSLRIADEFSGSKEYPNLSDKEVVRKHIEKIKKGK